MKQVFFFLLIVFVFSACSRFGKVMKSTNVEYKYKMAMQYYEKKKYRNAQDLFREIIPYYKDKSEFPDIFYKYAYTAYYMKDYDNAESLFKNFLETFPNHAWAEEVDYMTAYCYYKQSPKAELDQTNTLKTIGLMQTFISVRPNSSRVEEATKIIDLCRIKLEEKEFMNANLYYNIGQYRSAAIAFDNLIVNFPDSKEGDKYKLMVIKSYYKYALASIDEKKAERLLLAKNAYDEFSERYPESIYKKDAEKYLSSIKSVNK
jgi:outer membrane protein assembly factor BamD